MTDEFDDAIRSRLHQPEAAPTGSAHAVLDELRPALRRARIKRSLTVGTATLSMLGIAGLGVAAATGSIAQEPADVGVVIDGDPLPEPTLPTTEPEERDDDRVIISSGPAVGSPTTTIPVPTTTLPSTTDPASDAPTVPDKPSSGPPASGDAPATTNAPVPTTASPTPTTATTTPSPTTAPPPPPSPPPPPATTAAPPISGQQTISSNCGSITVSFTGNDIALVSTQPGAGFTADVEDAGPEEVEVEFDNGDAECEIEAWVESGTVRFDVDDGDDDDDDDDDDD